jgi:DNA invertase Pin-like site-specific DNA recombinase
LAVFGYARVSTDARELVGQIDALKAAGAGRIFQEKISGARADRPQLAKLMATIGQGDQVIVTRLDRLGRSTRELLYLLHQIGDRGATFRSLADSWADTTTAAGKLMITILAGLAEFERSLILSRTSEGRARAIQRGVKMGRKPKLSAYQRQEALARLAAGETTVDVARSYGVHHSTISRLRP